MSKAFNSRTGGRGRRGDQQMEGPTTKASQPAPQPGRSRVIFTLALHCTGSGPKTVAAACGNWLMSHPVTAPALVAAASDSWSQLEGWPLRRRAVCHPRLE